MRAKLLTLAGVLALGVLTFWLRPLMSYVVTDSKTLLRQDKQDRLRRAALRGKSPAYLVALSEHWDEKIALDRASTVYLCSYLGAPKVDELSSECPLLNPRPIFPRGWR